MVHLERVFKSYRQGARLVEALRGVDLAIAEPGFVAIMGRSGSGKSTLMHLLAGLDRCDQGVVRVAGDDLGRMGEGRLTAYRRRQVGVVFQQFNLIPTLTARQNVALPAVIDGKPRGWIDNRVDELLDQLGMAPRANHRPDALSGGEQQRVAVARALLFDPPMILADEPTGNLDSANAKKLWSLLQTLAKERNMMVVMVTHESAAATYCDHVYVLGDGHLVGDFEVNDLDASGVASRCERLAGAGA